MTSDSQIEIGIGTEGDVAPPPQYFLATPIERKALRKKKLRFCYQMLKRQCLLIFPILFGILEQEGI